MKNNVSSYPERGIFVIPNFPFTFFDFSPSFAIIYLSYQ